ncbi:MAG: phenylalanine--tRNA ligase subunit beta [Candidatus Babeliales bacterium]|nr:phenylalanine--tRNA ligase subunit beta [Candidatus Babeliales bacterium]
MKLSIAWIFDHIDADWKKIDVAHLVQRFNQMVAEIEGFTKIHLDLAPFSIACVTQVNPDNIVLLSKEWSSEHTLPYRKGALVGQYFLIKKDDTNCVWGNAQDLGGGKDMLIPPLKIKESDVAGQWKQSFEAHDYILEIDNKSITHRPDMWGHRGFAREVAALLDLPFKEQAEFVTQKNVNQQPVLCSASKANSFLVQIDAPQACKQIAAITLDNIQVPASSLWMAHRLARVDARAIDGIVDITNYVMLDWGQPMHAFDSNAFDQKQLIPRMAKNKESLTLLDGETIELTEHDLVVTDGIKPLALGGVMGGRDSGVNANTTSMIIESACFDAATIRKTAARYKKRTEASVRFEKSLDPYQTVVAIMRFIKLMRDAGIQVVESEEISTVGAFEKQVVITITHEMIEKRLGVTVATEFVCEKLSQLGFGVTLANGTYTISVPTFRATKDIKIKEDIIEEIGRYYGYTVLQPEFPRLQLKPSSDLAWVYNQRTIKQTLAYACNMQELYTYAFFDEEFLTTIKWQPGATLEVQSPVSENWRRLVTSLVPNLLKSVVQSSADFDQLNFFELARTWHPGAQMVERKSLAGIFFEKNSVDFYDAKRQLQKLFVVLKLHVEWKAVEHPEMPWYAPYQTAHIMHNDTLIGIAGKVHSTFLSSVCQGDAFIFEFDADFLLNYKHPVTQFVAASKYPEMVRDISMLIDSAMTSDQVAQVIAQTDCKITHVSLLDFFQKDEWPDKRAMTFRFVICDHERTMKKEEADVIWDAVAVNLKHLGAAIR